EQSPDLDVLPGVADDRRLAGCPARGVDPHDVLHRHREHAERIILPKVLLGRERELGEVARVREMIGMDASGVELLPIMGDLLIGEMKGLPESGELQTGKLVPAGPLDRLDLVECAHAPLSFAITADRISICGSRWEPSGAVGDSSL